MTIKIGIAGYGNLGKGVENAVKFNDDIELVAIFTRRDPKKLNISSDTKIVSLDDIEQWKDKIDVLILCGGSATDLILQTPKYAKMFNVVDSFDTHAKIPEHFDTVDKVAKQAKTVAIISIGWDPGLFSLNRMLGSVFIPEGHTYTFWGKGVSQGHSDAVRRIPGVKNAKQYTIPIESALLAVRSGQNPQLTTRQKHRRECFVVLEEGADAKKIEQTIKTMPNYFDEYDTTVNFISEKEFNKNHSGMAHGGLVLRSGKTSQGTNHLIEFSIKLDSNPEFTSSILVAYARAAYRLNKEGQYGCKTIFDIAPAYLSPKSSQELRKTLL